jgi:hypothetical protein
MAKSVARSVGSSIRRRLARGVLETLLKECRRRSPPGEKTGRRFCDARSLSRLVDCRSD